MGETGLSGISHERVENVLSNELGMTKVSARWGPRQPTPDHMCSSFINACDNLHRCEAEFVAIYNHGCVWVRHYQPETVKAVERSNIFVEGGKI